MHAMIMAMPPNIKLSISPRVTMPIQCRQVRVDKLKSSRLFFAILVAAFAASGGCGSCGGTVLSTNGAQALFAASPCPALPALANVRCGYLVVPEDRAQP